MFARMPTYTYHSAYVEVRGQLCVIGSFLPSFLGFQGLNAGYYACTAECFYRLSPPTSPTRAVLKTQTKRFSRQYRRQREAWHDHLGFHKCVLHLLFFQISFDVTCRWPFSIDHVVKTNSVDLNRFLSSPSFRWQLVWKEQIFAFLFHVNIACCQTRWA